MEYYKQGHAVYYARYHIVICTKYRYKILKGGMGVFLKKYLWGVERRYPEIKILESNTGEDHLHMLVSIPPKMSVSEVINVIKSNTAREMRKKYHFLDQVYVDRSGIWSVGYFVSTVGINEEIIRNYIEHQGKEDSGQAKLAF